MARARIGVDIGGTFTDIVIDVDGTRHSHKILTTPERPEDAVIDGMAIGMAGAGIGAGDAAIIVHGTTLATNAVIERKGARTALIATAGFRDTLEIADEGRFDQYDVFLTKPAPLVPREHRFTVPERISAEGEVLLSLDEAAVRALVPEIRALGIESVAIALLHSYVAPSHEERIAELIRREWPEASISLSSEICPEIREYERTSTTVINAYVQPLIAGYLGRLQARLTEAGFDCPIFLMASGGNLATLETARRLPVRLIESGPAGGAILAADLALSLGAERVLSFDMGGTTAKICLIERGKPHTARKFEVDRSARFMKGSGFPLRVPAIEMVEIGAGGGSIASLDSLGRIQVGPGSAGAEPGPVAYGRGGERPTVTDADLLLGKLDAERFAGGSMRLDAAGAASAIARTIGEGLGLDELASAAGIAEVVDENMANAARVHTVESGVDVSRFTMIAFGGAAPLHAARIAEKLGIWRVVVPADAGVGSAVGFLAAPIAFEQVRSLYQRLARLDHAAVNDMLNTMRAESATIVRQGAAEAPLTETRTAFMRYVGQGHEIAVGLPPRDLEPADLDDLHAGFEIAYRTLFERIIPGGEIECLTWTVKLSTHASDPAEIAATDRVPSPQAERHRQLFDVASGQMLEVPIFQRQALLPGTHIDGPCLIEEPTTTIVVSGGFQMQVDGALNIILDQKVA